MRPISNAFALALCCAQLLTPCVCSQMRTRSYNSLDDPFDEFRDALMLEPYSRSLLYWKLWAPRTAHRATHRTTTAPHARPP